MALDHELRRWAPPDVSMLFTRTPYHPLPVTVEMAERVASDIDVRDGIRNLSSVAPDAYVYACTSGSFVHGLAGERALREAMHEAGAQVAVTAAGSLLEALRHLGVSRIAVATPYDAAVTERMHAFLGEAGVEVVASAHLGLTERIWRVPYRTTAEVVASVDDDRAEAVVVSCTNLATYDLVAPMERRLGKPVVSANQATVWEVLRALGRQAVGEGQRLVEATMTPAGGTA
ncbi:MAG: maleate cis-trans isomerase family protein [Actinomycetota bacterium]